MLHHRLDLNSSGPLGLRSSLRNNLTDEGLCKVKFEQKYEGFSTTEDAGIFIELTQTFCSFLFLPVVLWD